MNGSGARVQGDGMLALDYRCNGVSRTLTIRQGSSTGSTVVVGDRFASSADVPLAADRLAPSSPSTLAPRRALSRPVLVGGASFRWILAWDSGPYIVDGTAPRRGTYPPDGSLLRLFLIPAS